MSLWLKEILQTKVVFSGKGNDVHTTMLLRVRVSEQQATEAGAANGGQREPSAAARREAGATAAASDNDGAGAGASAEGERGAQIGACSLVW